MSLKYRTGQGTSASDFTDLVVKVGDTLPIGSEIDYDGQTVPAGWQEVDETNLGDVVVDSIKSKNIFDPYNLMQGSVNPTTGAYSDSGIAVCTDFVEVDANTTYTIKMFDADDKFIFRIVAYDVYKNYYSTIHTNTSTADLITELTFTTVVKGYIRICFGKTGWANLIPTDIVPTKTQLEKGDSYTEYRPYQKLNPSDEVKTFTYTLSNGAIYNFYKCGKIVQCELVGQNVPWTADTTLSTVISNELAPCSLAFRNAFLIQEGSNAFVGYLNIYYETSTGKTTLQVRSKTTISSSYPRAEVTYISM